MSINICQLYVSSGHNFFGHHGREPDEHLAVGVPSIDCVAGRGIWGDRFFDYKKNYKGQITSAAVMRDWLGLEPHHQGPVAGTRLGKVMRRLGFTPVRIGQACARGWQRTDTHAVQKTLVSV